MKISANRSPDSRLRTEKYNGKGGENFSIAEVTATGTLISEFKYNGEIVNQEHFGSKDSFEMLSVYLKEVAELELADVEAYEKVKVAAACAKCGSTTIERDLDARDTMQLKDVPVVPLFICKKCGAKFYSMSDAYLRNLVGRNASLFETDELAERDRDENKFVHTLQEYIIRIFASKKIHRLEIKG